MSSTGLGQKKIHPRSRDGGASLASAWRITLLFSYAYVLYILDLGILWWLGLCSLVLYDSYRQYVLWHKQREAIVKRRMLLDKDFIQIMQHYPSWINFSEAEKTKLMNTALTQLWPNAKLATEDVSRRGK